jgi:hypothetical protein
VHAWRALGQLRAEAAIEPLLSLLQLFEDDDDDAVAEELPRVYAMIGAAAIPALTAYLGDPTHGQFARAVAAEALDHIGQRYAAKRDDCVAALSGQLELFMENPIALNGLIVGSLLKLKAVESAPLIERIFAAGRIDLMSVGDWEDVQVELGLKAKREHPKREAANAWSLTQPSDKRKKKRR